MYPQTVHFHFFIGRNPRVRFPVLISQSGRSRKEEGRGGCPL
jgi:hypothetical protein